MAFLDSVTRDEPIKRRDIDGVNNAHVQAAEDTTWNRVVDVIVVGSGTGLMAALRTAVGGMEVMVLEKASELGGTMGISGGGLWIPNNYRMHEEGIDPDFHRGESDFDLMTAGDPERDELINPCLAPLTEPPFYATSIWPGALGTSGGLQTNIHAQVLNVWGNVIHGLYAVGNTAASPLAGGYPGGGGTLSAGLTFAFVAANHILAQRKSNKPS